MTKNKLKYYQPKSNEKDGKITEEVIAEEDNDIQENGLHGQAEEDEEVDSDSEFDIELPVEQVIPAVKVIPYVEIVSKRPLAQIGDDANVTSLTKEQPEWLFEKNKAGEYVIQDEDIVFYKDRRNFLCTGTKKMVMTYGYVAERPYKGRL